MPAIIHNSAAFANAGIAIVSQDMSVEPTGLVRVSVEYAFTNAKATDAGGGMSRLFVLDAPPPIYPNIANSVLLQSRGSNLRGLFCEGASIEKSFGQWRAKANYVGALAARSGFSGFITTNSEARVTPPVALFGGFFVVSARYTAQIIKRSAAGAYSASIDQEGDGGSADKYISRASYGSISVTGFGAVSAANLGMFGLPSPLGIVRSFNPRLELSTQINNVTGVIVVATTTQDVVLEPQSSLASPRVRPA